MADRGGVMRSGRSSSSTLRRSFTSALPHSSLPSLSAR
jgi:hypothetical protein